jgi:creatinine amidohydrolase
MAEHVGLTVIAGTPLEPLSQNEMLDHAARYETSQLLATRPDLANVSDLPHSLFPSKYAVLGENPRFGSAEEGQELFAEAIEGWKRWIESDTPSSLAGRYAKVKAGYAEYVEKYFNGSWEDAIAKWWEDLAERT